MSLDSTLAAYKHSLVHYEGSLNKCPYPIHMYGKREKNVLISTSLKQKGISDSLSHSLLHSLKHTL